MASIPQVVRTEESASSIACDALVVGGFSSDGGIELAAEAMAVDEALGGHLSELAATGFKAGIGDVAVVPTLGSLPARVVAVVGLGPRDRATSKEVRNAAGSAARRLADHPDIASLLHAGLPDANGAAGAAIEGFILGGYRYTTFKSDPRPSKVQRILSLGGENAELDHATAVAEATLLARDLTNEPASSLTPTALARRAQEVADVAGSTCRVLHEQELNERGFGGILAVSRGSAEPPCLIEMRYEPADAKGHVAIVGKGITYDTGGYTLKPAPTMENMKTDMAGAATVIGLMSILDRIGIEVAVTAYIPAAENMVSGAAIKPGDVFKHYNGKTTEVNNTDAEGRLVLADAVALASEESPDAIVDIATLTGHIHVALGGRLTGLFSSDDALGEELRRAGDEVGEPMWPMPLFASYRKELESTIADMKNAGNRYGGAISAALYIGEFVGDGIPWAHLDIAGTGRCEADRDEVTKGGTGVGVRTFVRWLEQRSRR